MTIRIQGNAVIENNQRFITRLNTATGIANNSFNVARTILGSIHIANGAGGSGNNRQAAITFQGSDANQSQAGIYVSNNNSTGTAMGFATTDSYASGPQLFMTATNSGIVQTLRQYFQAAGSARAPIFYDSNNTGFYIDPDNGGFVMRGGSGNRVTYRTDDRGIWVTNAEGNGVSDVRLGAAWGRPGVYSSSYLSLGSSGTYTEFVFNNVQRGFFNSSGTMQANGDMRSPIFYDSNDTSYYIDPNARRSSNINGFSARTKMTLGLTAKYQLDRADYTGDINYWVGTMGWGTTDFNTISTWGSGFIDTWSNPGNRPTTAYSHFVGLQAQHYNNGATNGTGNYGFQMVMGGGTNAPLYYRTNWNSSGSWKELIDSGTNQSVGGNKTFTGTGPFTNDWFRNNTSGRGLYNQATARHFYSPGTSYWHLDGGSSSGGLIIYDRYNGSQGNATGRRGYLYYDGNGFGLLHQNGGWAVRTTTSLVEIYNRLDAPIMYDSNNTGYYVDPASTTRVNEFRAFRYYDDGGNFLFRRGASSGSANHINLANSTADPSRVVGEGAGTGISWGQRTDSQPYYMIRMSYRNFGGSTYTKLTCNWHTGLIFGANSVYGGIRFYADAFPISQTLNFHINGGSNYTYKYTWMYTNTTGFYSDTNGWHIEPNTQSSYGSMNLRGSRNGWFGMHINTGNRPHVMFDGSGNGGFYHETGGRWPFYYQFANNCVGMVGSATSSAYGLYVSKAIFSTGNIVAFSDARKKENIITVDNALEKINQLRGVYYNRIDQEDEKREIGVIAQEVDDVLPEVVTYAEDVDEYGVSYGNLAGLFIEAIKEQNKIIESMKQEISELKEKIGEQ